MKNWKTTLAGLITAGGIAVSHVPGKIGIWGSVAAAIGAALTGLAAKDSNVTGGSVRQ